MTEQANRLTKWRRFNLLKYFQAGFIHRVPKDTSKTKSTRACCQQSYCAGRGSFRPVLGEFVDMCHWRSHTVDFWLPRRTGKLCPSPYRADLLLGKRGTYHSCTSQSHSPWNLMINILILHCLNSFPANELKRTFFVVSPVIGTCRRQDTSGSCLHKDDREQKGKLVPDSAAFQKVYSFQHQRFFSTKHFYCIPLQRHSAPNTHHQCCKT